MTFVNDKLGNGFRINIADSTRDQEHYFTDHKKHAKYFVKFLSASSKGTGLGFESSDYVSSSGEGLITVYSNSGLDVHMTGTLHDGITGRPLESEPVFPGFGVVALAGSGSVTRKFLAKITWEISSTLLDDSFLGMLTGTAPLNYNDSNNFTGQNLNISRGTKIFDQGGVSGTAEDGFLKLEKTFIGEEFTSFPMSLLNTDDTSAVHASFSSLNVGSQTTSSFRNIVLEFFEPLSNDGVKFYKDLDNQHAEFEFLNVGVLRNVED